MFVYVCDYVYLICMCVCAFVVCVCVCVCMLICVYVCVSVCFPSMALIHSSMSCLTFYAFWDVAVAMVTGCNTTEV